MRTPPRRKTHPDVEALRRAHRVALKAFLAAQKVELDARIIERAPQPESLRTPAILAEQDEALRYTAEWHVVNDWAESVVRGMDDITHLVANMPDNPRVALVRGGMVYDIADSEEAYELGVDLIDLYMPHGPTRKISGRRRVIIRVLTWIPDKESEIGYDPEWITTGKGMTARAASQKHHKFARDYADAVERGIESRRLVCTAIEVLWWTQNQTADLA